MNHFKSIVFFLLILGCNINSNAQESSVYLMGSGGSFSPLLPPHGFAGKSISGFYRASKYADKNGDKSDITEKINGWYQQFMVFYVTKAKIIGASYVAGAMLPFATAEKNPSGSYRRNTKLFMADPYISPLGLSWQKPNYQLFGEYRLYLPWGRYNPDNDINIGKGYYSHMVSLSGTYFFDDFKFWSATLMPRYEFHGQKDGTDVKPGSYFNLEWAITNSQNEHWDFGLIGYAGFQLTKDTGADIPPDWQGVKDRVVAIGGEIGVLVPKIKTRFALRGNFEVYALDSPIGTMITLDIYYVPNRILFDE